jgi:hypothetical protein
MRQIVKWRDLQLVYMPGAANPLEASEDDAEDDDTDTAEDIPLLLPSSLDLEARKRICLEQVAEHERLLRMAQLHDSLTGLRNARKVRRKLLVNHHTQVAGQGQRANTRSRGVMESVESRIDKFVGRYRAAYQALLQLDPNGDWQQTFLELNDGDNRGPGKDTGEERFGNGSYFRSWIWLSNPRASDIANGGTVEENASEEDVNDFLRVEWTTSFARLERWAEEVELLQEEMRRVVMFLEWRSVDWSTKVDARKGTSTSDVQSGLGAYARKQSAVYHHLAVSFAKLWCPTLVSYNLQHSWVTGYMAQHGISLAETDFLAPRARGIFKFRVSSDYRAATSNPSKTPTVEETTNRQPLLEEADFSDDSDRGDSDSDSEVDWGGDTDF